MQGYILTYSRLQRENLGALGSQQMGSNFWLGAGRCLAYCFTAGYLTHLYSWLSGINLSSDDPHFMYVVLNICSSLKVLNEADDDGDNTNRSIDDIETRTKTTKMIPCHTDDSST